jgi:adenosylhomocysteinase
MPRVKDAKLADEGGKKIAWAEAHMPVLMRIREEFSKSKPFRGLTIACCLHVTKETGVLARTLKAGGARVALCGSNPLSTQDDIAAALAGEGIDVFAWRGLSNEEYYWCVDQVLDLKPAITMDDGGDLVATIHSKRKELLPGVIAGTEETTTGVIRFRAMEKDKVLKYPLIAVNDARSKNMFDNYYGTGQSSVHGIIRATNILMPGKKVVVSGYGHCGEGVASMARGMGAHVIVTEVDPVNALKAHYDGHQVMSMNEAAPLGDVFITVTGCKQVIGREHFRRMKPGAILANAGHFDIEIDVKGLRGMAKSIVKIRDCIEEIALEDGRKLYLLGEGRLVNLACGEGHPSEVMDQSFSLQALCAEFIARNRGKLDVRVYSVPKEIDMKVAGLKLESLNVKTDSLTSEQKSYLTGWEEGT